MASIIKLKRSSTPGSVPGSLATGEVALNLSDQVLFTHDGSNVVRIGGKWLANTNSFIKSQLANTNSFIKSQLANTNSYIATKVSTSTFNSALANTNTYIATKANATNPTTSGLLAHTGRATISTNLSVSGNTSVVGLKANNSLGSSGYVLKTNGTSAYWDAIGSQTQYLQVANAVSTYATKSNPTTSGLLAHTGRATISTNLAVTGNTSIGGNLTVSGNLEVDGGVTYISSSTIKTDDSMVKLAANNASNAIDTGIYGKYVDGATTKYAGYFLDHTDSVFKFFTGTQTEPTTTVNTGATGYAQAQVDAIIDGGSY